MTRPPFPFEGQKIGFETCALLYRSAGEHEFLLLTPGGGFAHVIDTRYEAQFKGRRPKAEGDRYLVQGLSLGEARTFLIARGEGDLVEDFPDLFGAVTLPPRDDPPAARRAGAGATILPLRRA